MALWVLMEVMVNLQEELKLNQALLFKEMN